MKRLAHACTALVAALLAGVPGARAQAQASPSLVVMIVVDQLDGDLVDRYESLLTGGFRRLLDEGHRFTQTSHAHAMTETAPGHATIATGVFPSRHGIVSNNWRHRSGFDWPNMYAVGDPDVRILGFENEPALEGRSPKNYLRAGLADWVRAQDPEARTVSISKKDRAAVTMAGQTTDNAWWLLDQLGIFITSTHYADRYPDWITRFNQEVMPGIAADTVWETLVPADAQALGAPDAADYEGDGVHTTFPHRSALEVPNDDEQMRNIWAFDQPRVDDAVLELAKTAIAELELGQREGHVDLLAVSFSAMDRVGHLFGPLSQETFSTLLNLDRVLGDLFTHLDQTLGEGRWVAGLAGDHGAVDVPERAREMGHADAERIDESRHLAELGDVLRAAAATGGSPAAIAERVADLIEEGGLVEAAYTHHELTLGGVPADSFAVLYRNSHYPGRAWGVLSRFGVETRYGEGDLVTSYPTGTTHGSPYWYDRNVEMMWLGAGVPAGSSDAPAYTVDFAPTLAALGRIRAPDDLDGRRLF